MIVRSDPSSYFPTVLSEHNQTPGTAFSDRIGNHNPDTFKFVGSYLDLYLEEFLVILKTIFFRKTVASNTIVRCNQYSTYPLQPTGKNHPA